MTYDHDDSADDLTTMPMPEWAKSEGWSPEEWAAFMEECETERAHYSNDMADDVDDAPCHDPECRACFTKLALDTLAVFEDGGCDSLAGEDLGDLSPDAH